MTIYVQAQIGPFPILIDARNVLEVIALSSDDPMAMGCRAWREHNLDTVIGRELLGLAVDPLAVEYQGIVYSHEALETPVLIALDSIQGLKDIPEQALRPFHHGEPEAKALFDTIWLDAKTDQVSYLLRRDLKVI